MRTRTYISGEFDSGRSYLLENNACKLRYKSQSGYGYRRALGSEMSAVRLKMADVDPGWG